MNITPHTPVTTFTVTRADWYRGKGASSSRLLTSSGKMCCLGFYSLACGLEEEAIRNVAFPSDIQPTFATVPDEMQWLFAPSLPAAQDGSVFEPEWWEILIGSENDDADITDEQREERIATYFATRGITVVFTD